MTLNVNSLFCRQRYACYDETAQSRSIMQHYITLCVLGVEGGVAGVMSTRRNVCNIFFKCFLRMWFSVTSLYFKGRFHVFRNLTPIRGLWLPRLLGDCKQTQKLAMPIKSDLNGAKIVWLRCT